MSIKITGGSSGLHCHCGNGNGNTDAACVMHLLEVRQTLVMQRRFARKLPKRPRRDDCILRVFSCFCTGFYE